MPDDTYIDYQKFSDGSQRWLWLTYYRGRLWRAGVEHRLDDARHAAAVAWTHLRESLSESAREQLVDAEDATAVDFNRVERGESDDPPPSSLIV